MDLTNHKDMAIKFGFKSQGELIHEYFGFDGEFIGLMDTEVITSDGRNLRMDICYKRSGYIINNTELQSKTVGESKLRDIAEYIKYALRNEDQYLADAIILTTVDPKNCKKYIHLTETLILKPKYVYIPPDEIMEMFNNIKNKVLDNQLLTHKEELEFAIITIFCPDNVKNELTSEICNLFEKYSVVMDDKLAIKIAFILNIMIDRNVLDEKKYELRNVINMEKQMDSLEDFLEEYRREDQLELRKANTELKNMKITKKEDEIRLKEQDEMIESLNKNHNKAIETINSMEDSIIKTKLLNVLLFNSK